MLVGLFAASAETYPFIEVTGSATVNIVPDRITIEIGIEEYYRHNASGDSSLVKLRTIEDNVRHTLRTAGVPDSMVVVTEMGNYRNRQVSSNLLMAKKISATLKDFNQVERIAENMERNGVVSFNITKIDNSNMEQFNRDGLKAALNAARAKAGFIAANEGLKISLPYEIVENGPNYYDTPTFSNVAFTGGSGMDNMRHIVRRYSVKVKYPISPLDRVPDGSGSRDCTRAASMGH